MEKRELDEQDHAPSITRNAPREADRFRRFVDSQKDSWEIWEVSEDALDHFGARDGRIPNELAKGWLAFQSRSARRRLANYPSNWLWLTADGLRELLSRARPVDEMVVEIRRSRE